MTQLDPDAAMDFLTFVAERHRIWEARQAGAPQPWTEDPTLASRKFTNVFRVLDPGSQFVLTDLWDPSLPERDLIARCFLYRCTNLPRTWEYVRDRLGRYPLASDLTTELTGIFNSAPRPIFSGAYMIAGIVYRPGDRGDKMGLIVEKAARLLTPGSPDDLVPDFLAAETQAGQFAALRRNPGIGDFMSQQILTDVNYLIGPFREDETVVPGPGAIKGAKAIGMSAVLAIDWAYHALRADSRCPLVKGRAPSLMDVQNCYCEYSKYIRGPRAVPYAPTHPGPQPAPLLPDWWTA